MEQVRISVGGMSCTGCERRIERAVQDLDGIRHVKADHRAGAVAVLLDEAQSDEAAVRSRIEQVGYEVRGAA